jgi:hypothetical protein
MEIVPVLRLMWRRRFPLAAGVLAAVAILVTLGGTKLVTSTSAVAWTRVALDTPKSQLVDASPSGAGTLAWRTSLLSHLMATEASTQDLAKRLGVKTDQVAVVDPTLAVPLIPTDMATAAAQAASSVVTPYVLTVSVPDALLPVISVEAAAPDQTRAKRLADAAVAVLESQASPGGHFASQIASNVNDFTLQQFVIGPVGPVRAKLLSSTALPVKAIGASLFVFLVWCAGVLLMPKLTRTLRAPVGRRCPPEVRA